MKIKTNLPKAIIYKEPDASADKNSIPFKPNALPSSDDFIKVIYEGGYFVAIGKIGTVAYSENGDTWTVKKLGDNYTFNNIEYIKDEYVIVGYSGKYVRGESCEKGLVVRSKDLINWNSKEVESDDVTENNLKFFGIMHNGTDYVIPALRIEYFDMSGYGRLRNSLLFYKNKTLDTYLYDFKEERDFIQLTSSIRIVKGNNRIGIKINEQITYTTDGENVDYGESNVFSRDDIIFFNEGYFMEGIGVSNYSETETYGYIKRSINLKEWETISNKNWRETFKDKTINIHSVVHVGDYCLYVGAHDGLIIRDNEDFSDKNTNDIFTISASAVINSAANSDKKIVCVGNGGIIFTANVDISDKSFTIEPSTVDSEIYLRVSDNIRLLNVKAVTSRIDENIKPENIKAGVTILGVTGTHS